MGLLKLKDPNEVMVQACATGEETVRVPLDALRKQMSLLNRLKNRLRSLELVEDDEDFISAPIGPTFQARVQYVQPTFAEFVPRFDLVYWGLNGASIEAIDRCKHVSREEGECVFGYLTLDRDATVDECLIMHDHSGLRPTLYEELLAFAQQFPDELRRCEGIAALGSVVKESEGFHSIAFLNDHRRERKLDTVWIGSDLPKGFKLLGVLEDS